MSVFSSMDSTERIASQSDQCPPDTDPITCNYEDSRRGHGIEQAIPPDPPKRLPGPLPFDDGSIAFGTMRIYEAGQEASDESSTYIRGCNGDDRYPHVLITNGLHKGWIRLDGLSVGTKAEISSIRVYLLPEDVDRSSRGNLSCMKDFRKLVKYLLDFVDCTVEAWIGSAPPQGPVCTYRKPRLDREESLFYIFNTLHSPRADLAQYAGDIHGRKAIEDVLNGDIIGLKTSLYAYQKRSVAAMVQKEASPAKIKDPRKTKMYDIYNNCFYLDVDEGVVLRNLPLYFETKGGVLAETMGYGKTLICLALVLATRGHYPLVPQDCLETFDQPVSEATPSLLSMAARQLKHKGLPWKNEFFALRKVGLHYDTCITELKKYERAYNEPMVGSVNPQRKGKPDYINTIRLCSATLIIVPPNLIIQWQQEIKRHVDEDALDVLVIDTRDIMVPRWQELVKYDVVLMSKSRFEQEYRDDELNTGNRTKFEAKYKSPLTEVRWLRVICDEGHGFAGSASKTNAMAMLDKMFIERRWVVSGTPSRSLHGVEVGLSSVESGPKIQSASRRESFGSALQKRQSPIAHDAESRDLERLRLIVVNFLKLQPWANGKDDKADWKTYLAPRVDEAGHRHSMPALREVMQTLIVRHKIQDVDCDLTLPPLYNKVVRLAPSYYDRLSVNLFVMLLTSNYVTSEREDEDYMFHPKNRAKLSTLITNLGNATFYCISFTEDDIRGPIDISNSYLNNRIDRISDSDGILLTQAIMSGKQAINDPGWRAFSTLHEMGTYIGGFPDHAKAAWALDGIEGEPLLLGTTQTREVQRYVRACVTKSMTQDPCSSLSGAGIKAMNAARKRAAEEQKQRQKIRSNPDQTNIGASEGPQKRAPSMPSSLSPAKHISRSDPGKPVQHQGSQHPYPHPYKLPNSQILGFASSKLTYMVNRILYVHPQEKSIIFYTHNNTAFFIAEALELLGVSHLIYANTLSVRQRAEYLAQFNSDDSIKVLLMDLKQAGQGLHVAAASRVYIVNPIWDGAVESQAVKRAHRIGQTREVFVETLVLAGTIEEAMIQRRSKTEHQQSGRDSRTAKGKKNGSANAPGHAMLDDSGMVKVLKEIRFLPFHNKGEDKFARLEKPVPLFRDLIIETEPEANDTASGDKTAPRNSNSAPSSVREPEIHHSPSPSPFPSIFGPKTPQSALKSSPIMVPSTATTPTTTKAPDKRKASIISIDLSASASHNNTPSHSRDQHHNKDDDGNGDNVKLNSTNARSDADANTTWRPKTAKRIKLAFALPLASDSGMETRR